MTVKVKVKVNPKLYEAIRKGANAAAERTLADLRKGLATYTPEVYQDYGAELSNMLKRAGIEPVAGALLAAWGKTIDEVKLDRRYRKCTMKIFDAKYLQAYTPWIGTTLKPRTRKRSDEPRLDAGYGKQQQINLGDLGAAVQDDGAYRPLPAATAMSIGGASSSFVWSPNPYQGYGYWLLYEQGYHGGGVAYEGRFFIRDAYSGILDVDANRMFHVDGGTLGLNQRITGRMARYMAEAINKAK